MTLAMNRLCGTLVATAVGLLASGCGSGHGSAATKPPTQSVSSVAATATASTTTSATSATTDPAASSPTEATSSSTSLASGVYLATLLAAPTTLGKALVIDAKADFKSSELIPSQIADVTQADCSKTLHSDWTLDVGTGNAFASRMYKNGDTQEVTEQFDNFEGPDKAQSFMKNIRQLATVCTGHTTDTETQSTVTFEGKAVGKLGDEAYAITGTDASWNSGETLEAVRVGDVVVTTFALDGVANDNGAGLAAKVLADAAAKLKSAT
ncbi:hypothetical protein [Catenulispora rubra]|uniref:hypothetical protein n=1 Tax=Catenulispora rubra TaxID=280293 RepID=UPI0018927D82|nr:hypothetical protein [Catenulispora rubra]